MFSPLRRLPLLSTRAFPILRPTRHLPLDHIDPQIDYPKLPYVSAQLKDPSLKYDDPIERRNYNDPVHEEDEVLGMWAPDVVTGNPRQMVAQLVLALSGIAGFAYALSWIDWDGQVRPMARRTYPYDGLKVELGCDPNNPEDVVHAARSLGTDVTPPRIQMSKITWNTKAE